MALTTQQKIDALEEAIFRLVTGDAVSVVVDQNGERVEYFRASLAQMQRYLYILKAQLAAEQGKPLPGRPGFPVIA